VAYRGRVLVELETVLDNPPDLAAEDISEDNILRVKVRVHFRVFIETKKHAIHTYDNKFRLDTMSLIFGTAFQML